MGRRNEKLVVNDAGKMVLLFRDEIRRSNESRYHYRLHAVLMVDGGMGAGVVARLLGDSPRAVEYRVKNFNEKGLKGLGVSARPGHPARLSPERFNRIKEILRESPRAH